MKKVGIDLGSRFVKIAVSDNGKKPELIRYDTIDFYKEYIKRGDNGVTIDVEKLGLSKDCKITATGYGRNLMFLTGTEIISEIKAHFKGALKSTGENNFVLIDIGGQDSKVILAKDGYIENFVMNDKCAASTGRFAENACRILGMTLEELSLKHENPIHLSSVCTVFCESELIGLMASGIDTKYIAAGINQSIAKRLLPLIKSFPAENIFASGGVADNMSLLFFLSNLLGKKIIPLENAQFNGAIGCLSD